MQVIFKAATSLSKDDLAKVNTFAKSHGVDKLPTLVLDESLLAGFILEIDGIQYDYSLLGSINRLGKSL